VGWGQDKRVSIRDKMGEREIMLIDGTAMFLLRSMKITPSFGPKVGGLYKRGIQ
jgi:hypothetical protein